MALKERAEAEAAAAAARGPAADAASDDAAGDDDDEDDDEAELVRRRKASSGFVYALDPAERDRLEKEEADRLRQKREAAAAEEAKRAAEQAAKEAEEADKKMRALAIKEAQAEGGIAWLFTAGIVNKVPAASLPAGAAGRGRGKPAGGRGAGGSDSYYELCCELPSIMVGRIIGKGGATIKEITTRSGARISIDNGPPGMSLLNAAGRPEALESARALINNALAAPKPRG